MENALETPVLDRVRLGAAPFVLLVIISAVTSALIPVTGGIFALLLMIASVAAVSVSVGFFSVLGAFSCLLSFCVLNFLIPSVSTPAAMISLIPGAAGLVIGISARHRRGCSGAVTASALLLSAVCVAVCGAVIYAYTGRLDSSAVTQSVSAVYDYLLSLVRSFYEMSAEQAGTELQISEEGLAETVRYTVATLPGLVVALCEVLSFVFVKATVLVCRIFDVERGLPAPKWKLDVSIITASIFIITTVAGLVLSLSAAESVYLVFANLQIILTPGLALIGLRSIVGRFRRGRRGVISIFFLFAACIFLFQTVLMFSSVIVAFLGLIGSASVIKHKLPKPKFDEKQ